MSASIAADCRFLRAKYPDGFNALGLEVSVSGDDVVRARIIGDGSHAIGGRGESKAFISFLRYRYSSRDSEENCTA